jgi:hypothetical protein
MKPLVLDLSSIFSIIKFFGGESHFYLCFLYYFLGSSFSDSFIILRADMFSIPLIFSFHYFLPFDPDLLELILLILSTLRSSVTFYTCRISSTSSSAFDLFLLDSFFGVDMILSGRFDDSSLTLWSSV